MKLYVGPLPDNVTHGALKAFFSGFEKNISIEIRRLQHDQDSITYAHVTVTSERIAQKALQKLNGTTFRGQPVLVREFVFRAGNNERRALDWRNKRWKFFDRRKDDDRRRHRKMEVLEDLWMKANREQSVVSGDDHAELPKFGRA